MENSTQNRPYKIRPLRHDILIDWFQFTVLDTDIEDVIKIVFDTQLDKLTCTKNGINGYTQTYTCGRKMHVMNNQQRPNMGVNVVFSGSACREYEERYSFKNLIEKLGKLDKKILNINRIDIAIDYFGKDFSIKTIEKKVEKEQLTSRFKTVSILNERIIKGGERIGEQVTFGRKVSDLHIVFYNKLLERKELGYKFKKEINDWVRCELRFRHKNAQAVFNLLTKDYDKIGDYVKGVLRQYLSFKVGLYNGDKTNKYRDEECRWWRNFTSCVPRLQLEKQTLSSSIVSKRDYTQSKLSKMIALMHVVDDTFIPKCISLGVDKLNQDDWLMMNSYFIQNNMPFMTQDELNTIIENYKQKNNIKLVQSDTVIQDQLL